MSKSGQKRLAAFLSEVAAPKLALHHHHDIAITVHKPSLYCSILPENHFFTTIANVIDAAYVQRCPHPWAITRPDSNEQLLLCPFNLPNSLLSPPVETLGPRLRTLRPQIFSPLSAHIAESVRSSLHAGKTPCIRNERSLSIGRLVFADRWLSFWLLERLRSTALTVHMTELS